MADGNHLFNKNVTAVQHDQEEPPSLSDWHDYEPNLEFDDTELHTAAIDPVLDQDIDEVLRAGPFVLESPVSDGTIEENFEEQLGNAPTGCYDSLPFQFEDEDDEDFSDVAKYGIVEVVGDDTAGRRIIVVSACKLPPSREINHDRLLKYMLYTLGKYVEQDYSIVYFHYGLNSKNKPSVSWMWNAYRAFDRKYKKNLKALYLVHPTNFIRVIWHLFKAAISVKFGKKVLYLNYLSELGKHLNLDHISIPPLVQEVELWSCMRLSFIIPIQLSVSTLEIWGTHSTMTSLRDLFQHDAKLVGPIKPTPGPTVSPSPVPVPTQQFGVSLQFIKDNHGGVVIPPIVRQCVEFLSTPDALETEGIFRRSANVGQVKELQAKINLGETIDFDGNVHTAAVLLKTFLRELEEPLMTFELYDEITQFPSLSKDERPRHVKILILEKLPMDNYQVLKYIVQFLSKVMDRCDLNKMTSSNLAVVFGPNLVWSQAGQLSLVAIGPINMFIDFVLVNQDQIFII